MSEEPPFVQRAIGSAVVTGAALTSIGLGIGRPMVREGIRAACNSTSTVRKSSARAARELRHAALESSRPLLHTAIDTKDRARRRAMGVLPPVAGALVEGWRLDFIEAEKSVYYGSKQAYEDVEPRLDRACAAGLDLFERLLDVVDDVVDAGVAAAATVGEDVQKPVPRRAPAKRSPARASGRSRSRR